MGIRHGTYCLGCCWAIMAVLFVAGVMNLVWVATLTVFILADKFGRLGALIKRVGGLVMIRFGTVILAMKTERHGLQKMVSSWAVAAVIAFLASLRIV